MSSILGGSIPGTKKYKKDQGKEKNQKLVKKNKDKIKILNEKLKTKTGSDGKTRAQRMALERRKAKLSGTYKKPKTAQELAKERIAKKKENQQKSQRKGRSRYNNPNKR